MRTKKAILNYITDVLPMIILMFIGLVKIECFIDFLGQEKNGLYNLYSQIMAYVTIVDGGLTSAVLYRMFAPISEKNYKYLNSLLCGSRRIFNLVGGLVALVGVGVSFFLSFFVKNNIFEHSYLQLTFLIYLVGSVVPYFCVVSKIIMEAYQEKYICNVVLQSVSIIKGILEIVVLLKGGDLYIIISLYTLSNVISSLIVSIISKKRYKLIELKNTQPSYEILSDVKNLLVHKVGTLIAYNVDTIIISALKGLKFVTIYTSYNYIITNLTNILGKISYSMTAGVGDLLQEGKDRAHDFFCEFNSFSFYLGNIICVPLLIVINPFIDIWLGGEIETTFLLALAFTLNTFYFIIRMPFGIYVTSAGLFKQTRILPIMESIVNLFLSLILIQKIGVAGVLLATFAAYMISDYFIRPVIVYKNVFKRSSKSYYMKNISYIFIMIVNYMIISVFSQRLIQEMKGYVSWFFFSVIIFFTNLVMTSAEFYFTGNMLFVDRIKRILNKITNKNR